MVQAAAPAPATAASAASPSAAGGEVTLSEVTVRSNQLGEITEGSDSYTPGAVATATRRADAASDAAVRQRGDAPGDG